MLRGAELVIGGTRLNKAGYPQQNPQQNESRNSPEETLSSPYNDEIKLV